MASVLVTAQPTGGYIFVRITTTGTGEFSLYRVDGDGTETPVRNGEPAMATGGSWSGADFEAPLDEAVTYRAVALTEGHTDGTSLSVTLSSGSGGPWLGHPLKPYLTVRPLIAEFVLGARPARAQALPVFGRLPVGQSLPRQGYSGELRLRLAGQSEVDTLEEMLDDGAPLLLRGPSTWIHYGSRFLQIGDSALERLTRVGTDDRFVLTLPFTEVDRPVGVASGGVGFRWDDVIAEYDTWDDLIAGESTWNDVIDGVP